MDIEHIFLILFFVLTPLIIKYLEKKYALVNKIGAVLLCYGLGLIIGNMGIIPDSFEPYQIHLTNLTIPIALPLILFSLNVKKWIKMAGAAMLALFTGLFSVIVMIIAGYYLFHSDFEDIWKVAGMLTGIYTGGTPNMAAMKTALDVKQELYLMTHTYEVVMGAFYLVFVLSIGQRVFLTFLPAFKSPQQKSGKGNAGFENEFDHYDGIFRKKVFLPLLLAFGLSVCIVGAGYGISLLFPDDYQTAAIILLITTFGIILSFVPGINRIEKTFQGGMYIILIFCLVVASMADISQLANISFSLFWYVGLAMFGSLVLHAILARIFKLDADTIIVSSVALICSPPFVPVVAGALKNKEVILTGLTVGIAGYALGNYLGVAMAYLLK
jgi:uncharacterized membrane protein